MEERTVILLCLWGFGIFWSAISSIVAYIHRIDIICHHTAGNPCNVHNSDASVCNNCKQPNASHVATDSELIGRLSYILYGAECNIYGGNADKCTTCKQITADHVTLSTIEDYVSKIKYNTMKGLVPLRRLYHYIIILNVIQFVIALFNVLSPLIDSGAYGAINIIMPLMTFLAAVEYSGPCRVRLPELKVDRAIFLFFIASLSAHLIASAIAIIIIVKN